MNIKISYCLTCNYRPIAAVLSIAIQKETGIKPLLEASNKSGAFEIEADGELIYSKLKSGFFPDNSEIVNAVKARLAGSATG